MTDTQDRGPQLTLRIRGFAAEALVGVTDVERSVPQKVAIDIDIPLDVYRGGPPQVNYDDVCETLRALLAEKPIGLLEQVANEIGAALERRFGVTRYRIFCAKPRIHRDVDSIGMLLERK